MPHGPLVSCPIIFYRFSVPSSASSDRTGGSVISTLEEKDSYDVGGAKSDGHGGAESSCQKHLRLAIYSHVRLHPEVPLFALLRLVHLRIALLLPILGRSGCVQDGRVHDTVLAGLHFEVLQES